MSDESTRAYAEAAYRGTADLHNAALGVRNSLPGLVGKGNDLDDIVSGTYLRMCHWIESIIRLNKPSDDQAIQHGVRCIYELWFDLVDVIEEPSLVPKLIAFHFVSRFAAAERLVKALDDYGMAGVPADDVARQFISDPTNRTEFDKLRQTYWTRNGKPYTPQHWHHNLADRALARGEDEHVRYRRLYSTLCSYSHAGLINQGESAQKRSFCMGHIFVQSIFLEATRVVGDHFKIFQGDPKKKAALDEYALREAEKQKAFAAEYPE